MKNEMRDRLIELVKHVPYGVSVGATFEQYFCKKVADHLLANGVIVPPCKVGDTVYTNLAMRGWYYRDKDRPYSAKVVFIGLNNSEEMGGGLFNVAYEKDGNMLQFRFSDIGKSVFLTKEEAEKALREKSNEK